MADQQAPPAGPDLSQGVARVRIVTARRCSAMSAMKKSCWCVRAPRFSRSTPIAAIIMARSPKAWSTARASAVPGTTPASICAPGKPPARRRSIRSRSGTSNRTATASSFGKSASSRSRGSRASSMRRGKIVIVGGGAAGLCRRRDAAAAGLSRQHRDAEQRGGGAGGSAQPVEGLSRRQRAGRLAAAAAGRFLRGAAIDLRLDDRGRIDRPQSARTSFSPMAKPFPTTGCCWRPARSRCACRYRARTSLMSTCCARWPIAARSSRRPTARAARS